MSLFPHFDKFKSNPALYAALVDDAGNRTHLNREHALDRQHIIADIIEWQLDHMDQRPGFDQRPGSAYAQMQESTLAKLQVRLDREISDASELKDAHRKISNYWGAAHNIMGGTVEGYLAPVRPVTSAVQGETPRVSVA